MLKHCHTSTRLSRVIHSTHMQLSHEYSIVRQVLPIPSEPHCHREDIYRRHCCCASINSLSQTHTQPEDCSHGKKCHNRFTEKFRHILEFNFHCWFILSFTRYPFISSLPCFSRNRECVIRYEIFGAERFCTQTTTWFPLMDSISRSWIHFSLPERAQRSPEEKGNFCRWKNSLWYLKSRGEFPRVCSLVFEKEARSDV